MSASLIRAALTVVVNRIGFFRSRSALPGQVIASTSEGTTEAASEAALNEVLAELFADLAGFAGIEMHRRILGLAHVAELDLANTNLLTIILGMDQCLTLDSEGTAVRRRACAVVVLLAGFVMTRAGFFDLTLQ